jgi:hypothetical protein
MTDLEKALIEGTFEDLVSEINKSGVTTTHWMCELAEKAGLDAKTAYQLVSTIQVATKKQLMAELRKQTENMLYLVERV